MATAFTVGLRRRWPRHAGPARALIAGALVASAVLGACFLVVQTPKARTEYRWDHPDRPLTDDQARAQVLEPAIQISTVGRLQAASGGYTLMSCKNEADPPYQGAVYLSFALPPDALAYYEKLAAALVARGWTEGLAPNHDLPGETLTKDGVTAVFTRDSDDLRLGTVRVYGQCRDVTDHRRDTAAWVDVTDQLR